MRASVRALINSPIPSGWLLSRFLLLRNTKQLSLLCEVHLEKWLTGLHSAEHLQRFPFFINLEFTVILRTILAFCRQVALSLDFFLQFSAHGCASLLSQIQYYSEVLAKPLITSDKPKCLQEWNPPETSLWLIFFPFLKCCLLYMNIICSRWPVFSGQLRHWQCQNYNFDT